MKSSNKYKKLTINTFLFTIGSFGPKILTFLLVPLYTSFLTEAEYGVANIITTTVVLFTYIFTLNISDAVFRFGLDKNADNKISYFFFGLSITLIGSVFVFVLCRVFELLTLGSYPTYCYYFLFINYLLLSLYNLCVYYLRSIEKVGHSVIAGLIYTIFVIVSNILLLVIFKKGLIGYLFSTGIGYLIAIGYCIIIIKPTFKLAKENKCSSVTRTEMIRYSTPLIFNNVSWWINSSLDTYIIDYYHGNSATGIYGAAQKVPSILSVVLSIFLQAWGISVIQELKPNDEDGFFSNTFDIFTALTFIAGSVLILLNIPLTYLLCKKGFFEAWNYSSILIFSGCFSGLAGFVGSIFSVTKKTKLYALTSIIPVSINILLNFLLIPRIGLIGGAIATLISYCVMFFMRLIISEVIFKWKNHIIRDSIVMVIILGQLAFEYFLHQYFYLEVLFVLVILAIYFRELKRILLIITNKLFKKNAKKSIEDNLHKDDTVID